MPSTITSSGGRASSDSSTSSIIVPPNTDLQLNLQAMHCTAANYTSPTVWNPSRWIDSSTSPLLRDEKFLHKEQGFAAWAGGPRICPGMKFSQVEFTGVLSTVLRRAWIAPSVKGGGDVDEAVARDAVHRLVKDSHLIGATISIRRPEELCLKVTRR